MLLHIFSIGIVSTIAMTIFSYTISYITNNKFEEPQLLNILIDKLPRANFSLSREHILGWGLHLFIGIVFVGSFFLLDYIFNINFTLSTGVIFGFFAGLIGVCFWSICFAVHPNPPDIKRNIYYLQLIPAHIIFGITMIVLFSYLF